jgi:hypothetical protein
MYVTHKKMPASIKRAGIFIYLPFFPPLVGFAVGFAVGIGFDLHPISVQRFIC